MATLSLAGFGGMTGQMVRSVATRGRIIAMLAVAAIGLLVGVLIDRAEEVTDLERVEFLSGFGLLIFVPLVCVVMATATLGNLVEEKTLVYFWLRPVGRWQIAAAAWIASLVVLLPVVLIPMGVYGVVLGSDANDVIGLLVASTLGVLCYSSVFTFLGLLTKRALLWGLVYIVLWEGLIGGWSRSAGWVAIRTHTMSALSRIADAGDLIDRPTSTATLVAIAVGVVVVTLGLTSVRLNRMDVA